MTNIIKKFDKQIILIVVLSIILSSFYIFGKFKNVGAEEVSSMLNKNALNIVYIGRPSCPSCKVLQPKLESVMKKNMVNINYLNTEEEKKINKEGLNLLLEDLEIESVPSLVIIKDKSIVKKYTGLEEFESMKNEIKKHKFKL